MSKPDDWMELIADSIYEFDWVILFCIAICFIIIHSSLFIDNVLALHEGAVQDGKVTTYGYIVQLGLMLVGVPISRLLLKVF